MMKNRDAKMRERYLQKEDDRLLRKESKRISKELKELEKRLCLHSERIETQRYVHMATCKECLHYEACVLNEAYWVMHNGDQACSAFKDKSKYVEQKLGQWKHKGAWHIECSECHHILAHIGEAKNYCPSCGVKMDGE